MCLVGYWRRRTLRIPQIKRFQDEGLPILLLHSHIPQCEALSFGTDSANFSCFIVELVICCRAASCMDCDLLGFVVATVVLSGSSSNNDTIHTTLIMCQTLF